MKYLIIGASAAAINAVTTLRSLDRESEIVVVSKDTYVHSRCMIHKIIDGERCVQSIDFAGADLQSIDFAGADFFEKHNVKWEKGKSVTSIDADTKHITLDDNSKINFDKLLIATGAVSFVPPVNNLRECKEVYCLRDLEDALAIKKVVETKAKKIVVMGAGLVGMDAVSALLHMNLEIEVIEMADRILPLQLDEYAASIHQKKFEENGVKFHLTRKLTNVNLSDEQKLQSVELDDGTTIACDIILVASGVRPNISFLENSAIKLDKGIVVDDYMHTSHTDIFAAGDVTGLSGTWAAATKQAQTAAINMVYDGKSMYMDRYSMKNTMNFFGLPTLSIGNVTPPDVSYDIVISCRGQVYQKLILKDGIVSGAIFVGDISNKGHWQYIIKNKISLANFKKSLFNISYADFYEIDKDDGQYWYAV